MLRDFVYQKNSLQLINNSNGTIIQSIIKKVNKHHFEAYSKENKIKKSERHKRFFEFFMTKELNTYLINSCILSSKNTKKILSKVYTYIFLMINSSFISKKQKICSFQTLTTEFFLSKIIV